MKIFLPTLATATALSLGLALGTQSPASAQTSDPGNIFTPPSASTPDGGSAGRLSRSVPTRAADFSGIKRQKDGIPNLRQLRTLPSLTPQQRRQIVQIMRQAKVETQPLLDEAKSIGEKIQGKNKLKALADLRKSGALANVDPATRAKLRDIRRQIKQKRQDTWNQVRNILTLDQLQQLENMRNGDLLPTSLQGVNQ